MVRESDRSDQESLRKSLSEINTAFYDEYPTTYFSDVLGFALTGLLDKEGTAARLQSEIEVPGDPDALHVQLKYPGLDVATAESSAKLLIANLYHHALETLLRLFLAHDAGVDSPALQLVRETQFSEKARALAKKEGDWAPDGNGEEAIRLAFMAHRQGEFSGIDKRVLSVARQWLHLAALEVDRPYAYNAWKHGGSLHEKNTQVGFTPEGWPEPILQERGNVIVSLSNPKEGDGYRHWYRDERFLRLPERVVAINTAQAFIKVLIAVGAHRFLGRDLPFPFDIPAESPSDVIKMVSEGRMRIRKVSFGLGLKERAGALEPYKKINIKLEADGVHGSETAPLSD